MNKLFVLVNMMILYLIPLELTLIGLGYVWIYTGLHDDLNPPSTSIDILFGL